MNTRPSPPPQPEFHADLPEHGQAVVRIMRICLAELAANRIDEQDLQGICNVLTAPRLLTELAGMDMRTLEPADNVEQLAGVGAIR